MKRFYWQFLLPLEKDEIDGVQGAFRTRQKSVIARFVQQEIEDRYRNNRLLVMATNEVEPTIKAKLGDRIASRLFDSETGTVKQVYLTATDYRAGIS